MQQVVDLQNSKEFQGLDVELLSISPDSLEAWREGASEFGIETPVLSDADNGVASTYGVMQWAMGSEPGHTFVLIDLDGRIRWIRDYGAPQNGGLMYVPPEDLVAEISNHLSD
ncbi:MAG TPA: redoxin domain-containing protein [Actinomycetota bacterium]|jgi:peroxiredoxin|nr:redoxin domain-containing protein [Actinomycetota bacterium]